MPAARPPLSPRLLFALIMGGMLVWGAYVALGAYLYNYNPWRGVIVMACVGLFLGFWLLLLWNQSRRKRP
jgi:membrane protease YdiL (CAAX protease family)